MGFIKKNKEHIVDISILILTILFTLHVENKFNEYLWVKKYYWIILVIISLAIIGLTIAKVIIDRTEKNLLEQNQRLENENKSLESLISSFKYQISKPLEDLLHNISKELGFTSRHRITVYTYTNGCFLSIARYSSNPDYTNFGRISIKDTNEFIFKVWSGEENCQTNKICSERKMPTQKICVHFLYEKNDAHPTKDKVGLVVFESTEKKNKQFNNGKFTAQANKINEFMHENINIKQDLSLAIKEGL